MKIYNNPFEEITAANHLLMVPSSFPPFTRFQKIASLLLFYLLAAGNVAFAAAVLSKNDWPLIIVFTALTIAIPCFGHKIIEDGIERAEPMIVSERGIALSPSKCLPWEKIKAWDFSSYSGARGFWSSSARKGLSIKLYTGLFGFGQGPFDGGKGRSLFAVRGYFFNDEQQQVWERIMDEKGIPRNNF